LSESTDTTGQILLRTSKSCKDRCKVESCKDLYLRFFYFSDSKSTEVIVFKSA